MAASERRPRNLAPFVLLALAALVWIEPWLPGRGWIAERIGADAILRFVTGGICIYAALLVLQLDRTTDLLRQVLAQFKRFQEARRGGAPVDEPAARADAVRILASAMDSTDPEVRDNAHKNLVRLSGRDLGSDAAAWQAMAEQEFPRG